MEKEKTTLEGGRGTSIPRVREDLECFPDFIED
jgi:hypothetical protein